MNPAQNRILLLADDSEQAFEVVNYIGRAFTLWETEVVLFHVLDPVPDAFWDWEKDPMGPRYLAALKGWETARERQMDEFMDNAKQSLLRAGAQESSVSVRIKRREEGIARDILIEAARGYTAVAFGRKGHGVLAPPMLGSVAGKLLANLTDVTLCLVGGRPKLGKILIGVDSSAGASRAVSFTANHLGATDPSVAMVHVIRRPDKGGTRMIPEAYEEKLMENARNAIRPAFARGAKNLAACGIKSERITTKTITGVPSRAGAILDEARHGSYGTLVLGRRGVSEVAQFQMGRVAAKVTQIADDFALWIVS